MVVEAKCTTEEREAAKKLLEAITEELLKKDIAIDSAEIAGKRIKIECNNDKKAFSVISKMFGVEKVSFGEKEIQGIGGFPVGSKGSMRIEMKNKKLAREILNRKGIAVDEESDYVATENPEKFKKQGIFAVNPLFGLNKKDKTLKN